MSRPFEGAIPYQALEREFFRMIKDVFQPSGAAPEAPAAEPFAPPVDLYETAEETVVVVELPGVDPAQVEITAEGDVLTIRGTKPADGPAGPSQGLHERRFGAFVRKIPLTREFDLDAARAEGRHGVLTIRLPRPPAQKPRTIPIRTG
ncbi:Hsp20/alpha crystallin family protein [Paludisphaera mucosa]|uniref:Hsp20/alpha crystallin family protein n=1 Tax=Paludisphaera mucosa TaxID=3030827 RepID=A0ABT6F4X7_9BACT|nr:Hsp20/alpha crystallin family protein [Paludisphaera mucosa]MDG3002455.1 Hsp20/alpha crystallin family protein [Paludisphaera mucosa]